VAPREWDGVRGDAVRVALFSYSGSVYELTRRST